MKVALSLVFVLFVASCQQEEKQVMPTKVSSLSHVGTTTSADTASEKEDFSDLKKKDDEGCEDKTAEDIEKELAKKAAEMKKAAEAGKATGFSFDSGEPGCDPNADTEQAKH